jgi:hypothetical protein
MRLQFLFAALFSLATTAGSAQAAIKSETINYKQGETTLKAGSSTMTPSVPSDRA